MPLRCERRALPRALDGIGRYRLVVVIQSGQDHEVELLVAGLAKGAEALERILDAHVQVLRAVKQERGTPHAAELYLARPLPDPLHAVPELRQLEAVLDALGLEDDLVQSALGRLEELVAAEGRDDIAWPVCAKPGALHVREPRPERGEAGPVPADEILARAVEHPEESGASEVRDLAGDRADVRRARAVSRGAGPGGVDLRLRTERPIRGHGVPEVSTRVGRADDPAAPTTAALVVAKRADTMLHKRVRDTAQQTAPRSVGCRGGALQGHAAAPRISERATEEHDGRDGRFGGRILRQAQRSRERHPRVARERHRALPHRH